MKERLLKFMKFVKSLFVSLFSLLFGKKSAYSTVKYRFFYSKAQTMDDCNPLVKTPDGWKEYSEMRSDGGGSNWEDAVLVYESDECPEINPNMCGCCMRCSYY